MIRSVVAALAILELAVPSARARSDRWQVPFASEDRAALDAATEVLCGKQVALLGEAAHGNGHSDTFKSALVERLIERCGYRALLFESSFYEFVPLWRAKRNDRAITSAMLANAVGGVWKFDLEFQPLLAYLTRRTNLDIFIGGIDFQLGGLDQNYTNDGMIAEMTAGIEPRQAAACKELVKARTYGGLTADQKQQAEACLAAIGRGVRGVGEQANEQAMMLENLSAIFASGYDRAGQFIAARDRQMFENLQMLRARLPRNTKIIVWTANAHAANGADEESGFAGIRNLGSYVSERFGNRSYALGLTAYSGSQRRGRDVKPFVNAPVGSLEFQIFNNTAPGSVFLGQTALRKLGPIMAAPFGHQYRQARWWERFGGIVVFREDRAAFNSRYGN